MHANTKKLSSGQKTRYFSDIAREIRSFFAIHGSGELSGSFAPGISGSYVTECVGSMTDLRACALSQAYHTLCDPRLNMEQALELAFLVVDQLQYAKERDHRQGGVKQRDCVA